METKVRYLTILSVCIVLIFSALSGCVQKQDSKPVISDGERSRATWDVQNIMSKHNYYHAVGMHAQELKDIWVKEDGIFASSATFGNPQRIMVGIDTIKADYGKSTGPTGKGSWAMHLNTTPVIEVAGDGKTAKGIWYSPGVSVGFRDGVASGGWWWEKYGADFVKEDGEWRLWHIQMYYDHTPTISSKTGSTIWTTPPQSGGGGETQMQDGWVPNPNPYQIWGPDYVPELRPQLPEPYYTFTETFSYCEETSRGPYPRTIK
jgi:hypothetical protein